MALPSSSKSSVSRIRLPANDWRPRAYQRKLWDHLERGGKRAIAVWHRRSGKDDIALHWTAIAAHQRIGTYWHLLPEASQARKAIWEAINPRTGKRRIDEAFPKELRESTRENEMFVKFRCGSTWQVVGSDNYDSLVGSPPIGIVLSEWALANPLAWAYLRPILRENGGWALFIYTPRGRNHGATFYEAAKGDPEWFCERLTAEQTGVFPGEELAKELAEYVREFGDQDGKSRFEQEYLCSFDAAVVGAYYGSLMAEAERTNRICAVDWDRDLPVFTAWDLGYDDDTAIWFYQTTAGEIRLIDFWAASGKTVAELCDVIKGKPYRYADHWVPWDAMPKTLAANGRSIVQQAWEQQVKMKIAPNLGLEDGIQAARQALPRCWFDAEKCKDGIAALRQYQREWDDDKRCFRDKPRHDWTSHAADAFRYMALVWRAAHPKVIAPPPRGIREMTMDEAWRLAR